MLGYLVGPRLGAMGYNLLHTYPLPAALVLIGVTFAIPLALHLALIWAAHIAFDRIFGYGLKFPEAFGLTHLGRVGNARQTGAHPPRAPTRPPSQP